MNKKIIIFIILWILFVLWIIFTTKDKIQIWNQSVKETSLNSSSSNDSYKKVKDFKEINDIKVIPENDMQISQANDWTIKNITSLTYGEKTYSWVMITIYGKIEKWEDSNFYLVTNEKVLNENNFSTWSNQNELSYTDKIVKTKMNFADKLFLDDKKNIYEFSIDKIELNKNYEVYGIEIWNPNNPNEKAYIFYKFIHEEIKIKNEDLLRRFDEERNKILSSWAENMAEQLKELNIKYGFSK